MNPNIYYLKGERLVKVNSNNGIFLYNDVNDLRNYAFIYVYPDNTVDAVLRSPNLYEHFLAISPLLELSSSLKKIPSILEKIDLLHFESDTLLAEHGVMSIYYSTSSLDNKDAFGFMNIPENLTVTQRAFLKSEMIYFQVYEDVLLNQYDSSFHGLKELNTFGDNTFLEILTKLSHQEEIEKIDMSLK